MSEILRALVIIQARYKSSRLPGKALYPLAGMPMIAFLLRRMKTALPETFRIVLATGRGRENDPLAHWAKIEGVPVFRGSETDVVQRYFLCLQKHPANAVVRVTGDNPLTCPELLAEHVQLLEVKKADYVQFTNLPIGAGVDAFSSHCIKKIFEKAATPDEREHLNLYVLKHENRFSIHSPALKGTSARPDLRMTVDTEQDWKRMNRLVMRLGPQPWRASLEKAVEHLAS